MNVEHSSYFMQYKWQFILVMMQIMYSIFMCIVFIDCILQCSKTSNIYFIHSVSRGFNAMPPICGH